MASCRFTADYILLNMINTDDSDVETPPGTDDEDDNYEPNPPSSGEENDPENSNDNSDLIPTTSTTGSAPSKKKYRWMDKEFEAPDSTFSGNPPPFPHQIKSPLDYFKMMVTPDMLQLVADQTNLYSTQKTGLCLNVNRKHVEMVIGMFFCMGLTKMHGIRCYFETDTRYPLVADVMARNKLLDFLRLLHLVDNTALTEEDKGADKLWKIRPWLDLFHHQCLNIHPEECNSVDEMIIPFRGKFSGVKQYVRGKPHPWGFKVWCRTTSSGILCDFEVYTGARKGGDKDILGVGGGVVSRLNATLPENKNCKVFEDNFFTSMTMLEDLPTERNSFCRNSAAKQTWGHKAPLKSGNEEEGKGGHGIESGAEYQHCYCKMVGHKSCDSRLNLSRSQSYR